MSKNYRLPKSIKPYYYDLTVKTSFDVFTEPNSLDGDLLIKLSCLERTNYIEMHKSGLVIDETSIRIISDSNGVMQYTVLFTSYDNDTQIYHINLSQSLEANQNYSISLNFVGKIEANNFGFYKSFYVDKNGVKKYI